MGLSVTGADEAIRELEELQERIERLDGLDDAAEHLTDFMRDRFAEREAPGGGEWTPVTLEWAERGGPLDGLARSMFARRYGTRVEYGSRIPWASVHQEGDARNPARPFAPREGDGGPADDLVDAIAKVIEADTMGER